eukprot:5997448-Pyramimonas_sp.AAC.1
MCIRDRASSRPHPCAICSRAHHHDKAYIYKPRLAEADRDLVIHDAPCKSSCRPERFAGGAA